MKCEFCGKQNKDEDPICRRCGADIHVVPLFTPRWHVKFLLGTFLALALIYGGYHLFYDRILLVVDKVFDANFSNRGNPLLDEEYWRKKADRLGVKPEDLDHTKGGNP